MKDTEVQRILAKVKYRDWRIYFDPGLFALQVKFVAPDPTPGCPPVEHSGRWWRLSRHMVKSEIVQTAFLAVMTAEEHEIREHFLFQGQPVYTPHYDVDALVLIHEQRLGLEVRPEKPEPVVTDLWHPA